MEVIKTRRDLKRPKPSLSFSFTGDYEYTEDADGWVLRLLSDGTLTIRKTVYIDLFIQNGGCAGSYINSSYAHNYPTALIYEGYPGLAQNYYKQIITSGDYPIVIGPGGSGLTKESISPYYGATPSSAFGFCPDNGRSQEEYKYFGEGDVAPFDDETLHVKWNTSGVGGNGLNQYAYDTASDKSYFLKTGYGVYATYGGGNGSMSKSARGENGQANTGSGGGGGWWEGNNEDIGSFTYGGDGGSGLIVLRNAR